MEKLLKLIREKNVPEAEIDKIVAEAMEDLEHSNPRVYDEIKMKLKKLAYSIDRPTAETIVRNMRPKGQMWSYDQIQSYVNGKGIHECITNWYLVMNMCYNDYYATAKNFGYANDADFYYSLAKDFIEDPDAEPFKVEKYFSH